MKFGLLARHTRQSYICISAALFLFNQAAMAEIEEIKIGFSAPLTGAQSHYGKDMQNGIVLAFEQVNQSKPRIAGREVKFILLSEDDQADPKTATTVAQRLVDSKIKGMLGHFNSGTTIPASGVYHQAGIPQIAMATAPEYTEQGYKTTFRMMTSDTQQGTVMGSYAVNKLGLKNIAIVDDRTAYGQGLADQFEKAVRAAKGNIVRREYTNDKAVNFKAIITNLKKSKPQAIFYGGAEGQSGPLLKQIRELGIKAVFISGEMSKTDRFIQLAGAQAAEGAIVSLAGLPLKDMPGGMEYQKDYQKRFGAAVELYSPYAYDGAMALLTAIRKADSSDPQKYLPVLANIDMLGVTTKHIRYSNNGDLKSATVTVYKVENGRWKTLESIAGK